MDSLSDQIKKINRYTEAPPTCKDCRSFQEDMTTDNFGPGDCCVRNQEAMFRVKPTAICNKWKAVKTINNGEIK